MASMKVKCVLCGAIKTLSSIPTEQPMCDNDLNPMIPVEVST